MPPQDYCTPPELGVNKALNETNLDEKKGPKSQFLFDFLETETKSDVSDYTEETEFSSSTDANAASMTVKGIYTRAKVPRENELPKDYGLSHVKKDQVMCRRRMNSPARHVEEEDQEVEKAMFVPEQGLVGPTFFHVDLDEHDESDDEDEEMNLDWQPRIYEERAVLFQAVEHYEQLLEEPKLSKYFHADGACGEAAKTPEEKEQVAPYKKREDLKDILENPRFGEQIIVQGIDAQQIAIGDIFEIEGGLSPLKIEITCPRLCCAWVDKRNGSPFGSAGVKRFCNKNGLGGFFGRVLVAGELRDEMKFVRTAHPHPKWTLAYISYALYGEGPKTYLMAGWAHWQRSKEELKELCDIKQLGIYEWKEEAEYILKHWNSYRPEDKKSKEAAAKATLMGRIELDTIFESKAVVNLQQYYALLAKMVECNLSQAVPQRYLLKILAALVAFIIFKFMLSAAHKTLNVVS